MKQVERICFAIILSICVMSEQTIIAQALSSSSKEDVIIIDESVYARDMEISLSISGTGYANLVAKVVGSIGSNTVISVSLQKLNSSNGSWSTVKTWTKSSSNSTNIFETTYKLSGRGTYRAKMTATVKKDGKSEVVNLTSSKSKY